MLRGVRNEAIDGLANVALSRIRFAMITKFSRRRGLAQAGDFPLDLVAWEVWAIRNCYVFLNQVCTAKARLYSYPLPAYFISQLASPLLSINLQYCMQAVFQKCQQHANLTEGIQHFQ